MGKPHNSQFERETNCVTTRGVIVSYVHVCWRSVDVFFSRDCVCVCASSRADLVSHAEGLWSPRPTDHRIVVLNGPQIIKQATVMERNAEADRRSTG